MNTSPVISKNLVTLAQMLERLERSPQAADADQFRFVVEHLKLALENAPHDAALEAVLATFPSTAELYENMQYAHAGLCRSPLDLAMRAEMAARGAIDSARSEPKAA